MTLCNHIYKDLVIFKDFINQDLKFFRKDPSEVDVNVTDFGVSGNNHIRQPKPLIFTDTAFAYNIIYSNFISHYTLTNNINLDLGANREIWFPSSQNEYPPIQSDTYYVIMNNYTFTSGSLAGDSVIINDIIYYDNTYIKPILTPIIFSNSVEISYDSVSYNYDENPEYTGDYEIADGEASAIPKFDNPKGILDSSLFSNELKTLWDTTNTSIINQSISGTDTIKDDVLDFLTLNPIATNEELCEVIDLSVRTNFSLINLDGGDDYYLI